MTATSPRGAEETAPQSSNDGRLLHRAGPPLVAVLVAVALWWLVTDVLTGDRLLSSFAPQHAVPAVGDLMARGVLLPDVAASLWRLLLGMLIAAVIGIPVGLLVGSLDVVERATRPVFQFLRMISPLSWAPIAVAVFGIGHRPVTFLVAAAAVWPIVLNTAAGVHSVSPGHLQVARSLGASRFEVLTSVVLPTARGHVLTGLRLALGIAWVVLVPAEMLGVDSGLGYQILNSRDQLAYDQVMAVILVIGVLGYALDALARTVLRPRRG
ncbi:ABC transporter permease [Saccharopolyspora sp. NFXS83]|uniref:ABC transporter permease n=1 Tax=Saccharopolyspora sp. NFXS83 TaxID=2993560 RepID=UPI00224B998F|nr:ABC transporter permease [Saccharopolyspora sp. NFXS83]MCX2731885.1 ABC transporter permease [Saccharopolyspora sp. NFXS83]